MTNQWRTDLPDKDGMYIVAIPNMYSYGNVVDVTGWRNGNWVTDISLEVLGWMELPEFPRELLEKQELYSGPDGDLRFGPPVERQLSEEHNNNE